MTARELLERRLGGVDCVRQYLRGVEAGSELDLDAQRAMLAAIEMIRGAGGVYDVMAEVCPDLYAQAALTLCQAWSDAEDGVGAGLVPQAYAIIYQLRYDPRNMKEGSTDVQQ